MATRATSVFERATLCEVEKDYEYFSFFDIEIPSV